MRSLLRLPPLILLAVLSIAGPLRAEEPQTAAAVTEPGRSLARALNVVLGMPPSSDQSDRHLVIVLDAGKALAAAGFADAFADALDRKVRTLARTRITVLSTADPTKSLLRGSRDAVALVAAVRQALARPVTGYTNVHGAVRVAAGLATGSGDRAVLLVSFDNSDLEDDVEGTARVLRKRKVTFHALTKEAFLSDTYWQNYGSSHKPPRPLAFAHGGDAAFMEIPWGWLFQTSIVHAAAASGVGPYGLSHLALRTGGRVFLYAPSGGKHACTVSGTCLFCTGDHAPATQVYQGQRVRGMAPLIGRRAVVLKTLARDGFYRLVLQTWQKASKLGVLRSRPSVRLAAGTLKRERRITGRIAPVLAGLNLKRNAAKARRVAKGCAALAAEHKAALAGLSEGAGSRRSRGIAEYTLAMLQLTHFNLLSFADWCEGPGPGIVFRKSREILPPEAEPYTSDRQVVGLSSSTWCLCHGVAPFQQVRFGQSAQLSAGLARLEAQLTPYFERWAHSPFEIALRQAGIARFYAIYRGTGVVIPPKRTGSDSKTDTTDSPRPARGGGQGGGSSSGGPTTGG